MVNNMLTAMKPYNRVILTLATLASLLAVPACKQLEDESLSASSNPDTSVQPDDTQTDDSNNDPVFEPIQINASPQNQAAFPGETISFSVTATSNAELNYQWFHNNNLIPGANSNVLAFEINGADDSGSYSVVVGNISTTETQEAYLLVWAVPEITTEPDDVSVYAGDFATLNVKATGANIKYEWQKKSGSSWNTIANATSNSLLISNVDQTKATQYRVKVKNDGGEKISRSANVILKSSVSITSQPSDQSVASGSNASFSMAATGHGQLSYQWYKNTTALSDTSKYSGSKSTTLSIQNITEADASLYWAKVVNKDGKSASSNKAQLSVLGPAKITVQPANTTLYAGQSGAIYVAASGDQPMTFQWQRLNSGTWQNISGATSATLALSSVSSSDAGQYRCTVNNSVAKDTSASAIITVKDSVKIVSSPQNQTANEGDSVSFSINATGEDLSYEWIKNGQVLVANKAPTLSFASVKKLDAGTYSCRVYNDGSSVNCGNFTLSIDSPVVITQQPTSQSAYEGGSVTLSVEASGDPAPTVEWYFNNALVGNGFDLTLNYLTTDQAGEYQCVVTNEVNQISCASVMVTVSGSVNITSQPSDSAVNEGTSLTLAITAEGEDLNYEWSKNGIALDNSTATLTLPNISAETAGTYSCRAWNSHSSDTCNGFIISVFEKVAIIKQPQDASAFEDESVTLSVNATGNPGPTVDWYFNGTMIKSDSASLTLSPLSLAQAGEYQCQVTNSVNTEACNSVTVSVREKVRITKQPASQVLSEGDTITLGIAATGEAPIKYQCYHGTTLMITSTDPADLIIPSSTAADNGDYYCLVSNAGSQATSSTANVTVVQALRGIISLSWSAPSARSNGQTLAANEIQGYSVYMARDLSDSFEWVATTSADEISTELTGLADGDYYFSLTTIDIDDLESALSAPFKVTIE